MSKLGQSREPYYESIYVGDRTVLQIKGENIFVNASWPPLWHRSDHTDKGFRWKFLIL